MKTIHFKFNGGDAKNFFKSPTGWLALGDHANHADGTPLLSPSAATSAELEEYADGLKRMIDNAVKAAKHKLPS
jgi:hypothetical protein